ncbi:uncharacterized protein LOC119402288 isoform X2 [Rhipicephalus sanguineus]|uniref:uncharacterized protein LOC119402288 isoform X2 n=1 Tax=Rhipicephalus sanguineus TaxID=34632 RepID=UPI0020C4F168|nr:uncharacterized protein LOC119402288 isoform X2 [Rhipicephalus sanguineus]
MVLSTEDVQSSILLRQNMSYSAQILGNRWPPVEMIYNDTTPSKKTPYQIDLNLTYNQPDTYNCSVFTVSYPPYVNAAMAATSLAHLHGDLR